MIQVKDNMRIVRVDDRNLELQELTTIKKKGGGTCEEWVWKGYYGDVKSALMGALRRQISAAVDTDSTLIDVINRIEKAEQTIISLLKQNTPLI